MSNLSYFESRSGRLSCTAEQVFKFVTDIRNFERFAPAGSINKWHADKESCSFTVSMIGNVSFRLAEEVKFSKVVFCGNALDKNDFTLVLNISGNGKEPAEVKVSLEADLNPVLKMMAAKPVSQFLEMLIKEMEGFREWETTKE
jgi:carbon monoxide dehydrogenase subunit G